MALLAVECSLLKDLERIFSTQVVFGLSEEDLDTIASEADDVKTQREALEKEVKTLKEGHRICQDHYNKRTQCESQSLHPIFSCIISTTATPVS